MADALSRKTVQTLQALNAQLSLTDDGTIVAELITRPNLLNRVLGAQKKDEKISAIRSHIGNGKEPSLHRMKMEFCIIKIGFVYPMIMI